jgi:diguanylate cyclase (GGDEF)-like protein
LVSYWNLSASLILFFVIAYLAPELKDALRREKELVATDALTGVANRHTFYKLAAAEMGRLRRYKRPFTVIYIDIDNLKMVNYRHGHNAGDNILEIVAKTIKGNIREVDAVARFGGDEFAVLLPETASEQAQVVSSRLRSRLLDAVEKAEKAVSFSMGVVTFTTPPESVEDMMKKATVLMYAAKNSGTNMIEQDVFGGEGSA